MDKIGIRTIIVNFDDEQLPYLSLVQGDAKTRGFDIVICDSDGKEIAPSDDYVVELVATPSHNADTPYANRHTIKDGKYRVMIPTEALSESGFVFLQLVFYQKSTGAVIHTIEQKCPVYRSRGQEVVESNNLYVDITALRLGIEKIAVMETAYLQVLEDEAIRKSNEIKRETNESQRQKDEKSRLENETQRTKNENTRKDNENKRESSETERQSNETTRKSQETARQSAEDKRVSSETTRKSQETARQSAEDKRIADEKIRQSNETTRKSQETARKSNESKRENNEVIRIDNENNRIIAEKERETKFDGWDKTMEGIIPNATSSREGVVKISALHSESEPYVAVSAGKLKAETSLIDNEVATIDKKVKDINTKITELNEEIEAVKHLDTSGAVGGKKPIPLGNDYAFYGEVSSRDLINGTELAMKIGLSEGVAQNSDAGWLKFSLNGKILFVAKKQFRTLVSWKAINDAGAVYGNMIVRIGNLSYKVRLLRGIGENVQENPYIHQSQAARDACHYSEWNTLLCPISEESPNRWQYPDNVAPYVDRLAKTYTNAELDMSGSSWCQEACGAGRSYRGGKGVSHANSTTPSNATEGWRPVLELVE